MKSRADADVLNVLPTSRLESDTEGMLAFSILSRERTISSRVFRYKSSFLTLTWKETSETEHQDWCPFPLPQIEDVPALGNRQQHGE